jgi:DNA-binding transcriptional LysR family regulator
LITAPSKISNPVIPDGDEKETAMDISQARAFLAVAEELHFGHAAERLHIAQPPLSRTIKQLERDLGSRLFERNTRSVRLTPSGQALVGPAREAVAAMRRAEEVVRLADDGEVGHVRVSFAGLSTHRLVAELARHVRQRRPGLQLELLSQNFAQPLMQRLEKEQTDIAFGRWDVVPADVLSRVVVADSLVVAVPANHALAGREIVASSDLAGQSWISLPPNEGSVLTDRLQRVAREGAFTTDIVQIAPDTQTALALVSAQVGCCLTLRSVAESSTDPHVVFLPLEGAFLTVDMQVASRRDERSAAVLAVLGLLDVVTTGSGTT